MGNEKNNLDDLIGTSGGSPIIVQEGGGDKKILYILLIVLLILFLFAIGFIAFLGGKYFGQNSNGEVAVKRTAVAAPVQNSTVAQVTKPQNVANSGVEEPKATPQEVSELEQMVAKEEAKKAPQPSVKKIEQVVAEKKGAVVQEAAVEEKVAQNPVAQQEPVAQEPATQQQKAIQQAAQATTGKALSQEDLAKIAALVAKELAKAKSTKPAATPTKSTQQQGSSTQQDDAALAAQLEQAQTDTLSNELESITTNLKGDVKAGSSKKVDTFNKVVVANKGDNNDELAKLAQEIDTILKSDDVKENTKSVKYVNELSKEATQREKELRFIVVKKGDTLSSIAYRAYGRASAYTKIYEANPDIVRNPNRIYVGMRLRVPVDEEYKKQQGK